MYIKLKNGKIDFVSGKVDNSIMSQKIPCQDKL